MASHDGAMNSAEDMDKEEGHNGGSGGGDGGAQPLTDNLNALPPAAPIARLVSNTATPANAPLNLSYSGRLYRFAESHTGERQDNVKRMIEQERNFGSDRKPDDWDQVKGTETNMVKRGMSFLNANETLDQLVSRLREDPNTENKMFSIIIDVIMYNASKGPGARADFEQRILDMMLYDMTALSFRYFCSLTMLEELIMALVKFFEGEVIRKPSRKGWTCRHMRSIVLLWGTPDHMKAFSSPWDAWAWKVDMDVQTGRD
ncbi:uncharacterized protein BDZ99DRAFT_474250 [Mytilinidion resinicola]|uniref:Uncharacterized protein n=1 Tax=Mytilinidion resinicola TaxID=574789 RepID=A0A6A6YXW8_9PEZI|nr:uncharacterized protein BDZ99DRAFT_474250 [Mytilinidion resinicola]KAF2813620.1 hypothetical protein BDZ99DRAFT_474250 [Mytilinidion resinicola]